MTSAHMRQSLLDFFRSKQHTIVPSSSLMPDAPNLLLTNAGLNQFVPICLGQRAGDVSKWPGACPASTPAPPPAEAPPRRRQTHCRGHSTSHKSPSASRLSSLMPR
jgi:hypothetical protein